MSAVDAAAVASDTDTYEDDEPAAADAPPVETTPAAAAVAATEQGAVEEAAPSTVEYSAADTAQVEVQVEAVGEEDDDDEEEVGGTEAEADGRGLLSPAAVRSTAPVGPPQSGAGAGAGAGAGTSSRQQQEQPRPWSLTEYATTHPRQCIATVVLLLVIVLLSAALANSVMAQEPRTVEDVHDHDSDSSPSSSSGNSVPILPAHSKRPAVLLISFDGFRADYFGKASTPHLDGLMRHGVTAASMQPIFPSKTFPNHYTIVTGLYAESHGIVANDMWDPVWDATFTLSNGAAKEGRWWQGEPIWATAGRSGLKSACMFWPGSEAEIAGRRPTYYKPYNGATSYEERVRQVVEWLSLPLDERPAIVTAYFNAADDAGHAYGPDSAQVVAAIERLDATIGLLTTSLNQQALRANVDILLVSDHGMASIDSSRVVYLEDYIDLATVRIITTSPVFMALPIAPATAASVVAALAAMPHSTVWEKANAPARFHYVNNRRITPIVGVADDTWSILQ